MRKFIFLSMKCLGTDDRDVKEFLHGVVRFNVAVGKQRKVLYVVGCPLSRYW